MTDRIVPVLPSTAGGLPVGMIVRLPPMSYLGVHYPYVAYAVVREGSRYALWTVGATGSDPEGWTDLHRVDSLSWADAMEEIVRITTDAYGETRKGVRV